MPDNKFNKSYTNLAGKKTKTKYYSEKLQKTLSEMEKHAVFMH